MLQELNIQGRSYYYFSIKEAVLKYNLPQLERLPLCLRVILENVLRNSSNVDTAIAMAAWVETKSSDAEIAFSPSRVLMQDFTGVPAVVDLAAMRDSIRDAGGDPKKINPKCKVDLVIDHSVNVDSYGNGAAFANNVQNEIARNGERYKFLKWGQEAFANFRVVPPGAGICHQVNLEYLAGVVWQEDSDGKNILYPDTLVGTDSHTTMINGLGVLGWGVGGIEAEAAMLGQPISMLLPEVIGIKLTGDLNLGISATDLVLSITKILRAHGVVGKFIEFFGEGVARLSLEERATIANMSPEFGATCAFFPIDEATCDYLRLTGRSEDNIAMVSSYAKAQGLWLDPDFAADNYTETLTIDLGTIVPCLAGPKRPQDKALLPELPVLTKELIPNDHNMPADLYASDRKLADGDIVIAAITSCTNTSNPKVLIAAALLARNAITKGLITKPWVKTSFAPGSRVVVEYLKELGLLTYLEQLGFYLVGYGCTTCIGNSGPLKAEITKQVIENDLVVAAVLSGNRNFEGRVHPLTKANWLASPALVVAYALAGSSLIDISSDPIGKSNDGGDIYLQDIAPNTAEITKYTNMISRSLFVEHYQDLFLGADAWQKIEVTNSDTYKWDESSSYIRKPSFFESSSDNNLDIKGAAILALLGDSITTDHISPAGTIGSDTPAAEYLSAEGISPENFNSYGSRRGNYMVMTRGTFANIRLRNEMTPEHEGGFTRHIDASDKVISIYDCAMQYKQQNTPSIIVAGAEYGTGSSRDWAAKGTLLLGIRAVLAESFERIHRSNLIGMGVLPLEFLAGENRSVWHLDGSENIDIIGLSAISEDNKELQVIVTRVNGESDSYKVLCRIDTANELNYFRSGGILNYVLKQM